MSRELLLVIATSPNIWRQTQKLSPVRVPKTVRSNIVHTSAAASWHPDVKCSPYCYEGAGRGGEANVTSGHWQLATEQWLDPAPFVPGSGTVERVMMEPCWGGYWPGATRNNS